jgi:putative ABC transport system permease protein
MTYTSTIPFLESLLQDARFGWRILARRPGFSLVVIVVLALGIGANTAMFSIINAVLLRPLPYRDSGRLVLVWQSTKPAPHYRRVVQYLQGV